MAVERDGDRTNTLLASPPDDRLQDRSMTQVDAVEESDRCDGWFLGEWERPDPADHVHGRRAYTPCAPVPARGNLGRIRPVEDA